MLAKEKEETENKIDELNSSRNGKCYVCGKDAVQNWSAIIPEENDGLGFGSSGEKTRLAFIPVCKTHNLKDEDVIDCIKERLKIKRMEMLN